MSSELAELVAADADDKMRKAVEHTQGEFSGIRTGRASPALIEKLMIDYHGTDVPLQQLAGFSVPEARLLVVQPYDKSAIGGIEKAIQNSDLGINPANDGEVIRLAFPPLTEERRRELVRVVKQKAEDGRVAIRNIRRTARHDLEDLEKEKDISADELERHEKELDQLTQRYVQEVDRALEGKEKELLEV